jgi:hypothetical protein
MFGIYSQGAKPYIWRMSTHYDSTMDTTAHIARVAELLHECRANLEKRLYLHDLSKLQSPEKEIFDEFTPKLKGSTYGSDEYKEFLKGMKPALDHHYANNPHHPEHYQNGIDGMSLFDAIEMLMDWKAAGERHANGSISKSLNVNKSRFNISPQLMSLLLNTAKEMGWDVSDVVVVKGFAQRTLEARSFYPSDYKAVWDAFEAIGYHYDCCYPDRGYDLIEAAAKACESLPDNESKDKCIAKLKQLAYDIAIYGGLITHLDAIVSVKEAMDFALEATK